MTLLYAVNCPRVHVNKRIIIVLLMVFENFLIDEISLKLVDTSLSSTSVSECSNIQTTILQLKSELRCTDAKFVVHHSFCMLTLSFTASVLITYVIV